MATKPIDMTQRSAVRGLAAWIGKRSDAIVVMVVRAEDTVFWMHEGCRPEDAADLVRGLLSDMVAETKEERRQAREEALAKLAARDARKVGR